jgi:hypothetical protein
MTAYGAKKREGCPLQTAFYKSIIHLFYLSKTDKDFGRCIGTHFQAEGCCCLATVIGDGVGHKTFA